MDDIHSTMALVGIIGNGIVIAVYKKQQSTSATNEFLMALAVADMLTSFIIIPLPNLRYVPSQWYGQI